LTIIEKFLKIVCGKKWLVFVFLLILSFDLFAPPPPGPPEPPAAEVPIDGGLLFLILGGLIMFSRNIINRDRKV